MFAIPIINKSVSAGLCPRPVLQELRLRLIKGRKNLLLDLPPELRNLIYDVVISEGPRCHEVIDLRRVLRLARVNRQLRNEVMPAYFGRKGGFKLLVNTYPRTRFHLFCKHFSQYLQYVRYLEVDLVYVDLVEGFSDVHMAYVKLCRTITSLLIFSESRVAGGKTERRVGNDETDWDDNTAAAIAFKAAMQNDLHCDLRIGWCLISCDLCPPYSDFCLLAKQLKIANQWIQFSYSIETEIVFKF